MNIVFNNPLIQSYLIKEVKDNIADATSFDSNGKIVEFSIKSSCR